MSYSAILNAANPALQNRNAAFGPLMLSPTTNPGGPPAQPGQGGTPVGGPQGPVPPGANPLQMSFVNPLSQMGALPMTSVQGAFGGQAPSGFAPGAGMGQRLSGGLGAFGRMGSAPGGAWGGATGAGR